MQTKRSHTATVILVACGIALGGLTLLPEASADGCLVNDKGCYEDVTVDPPNCSWTPDLTITCG